MVIGQGTTAPAVPPKTILVVDDSITVRRILSVYLAPFKAKVLEAKDALEAMAMVQVHRVDLVIADVMMGEISGLQLAKNLRAHSDAKVRDVPLVLLTGAANISRASGLEAGATAFLKKPISPNELFSVIAPLLGQPAPEQLKK